MLNKTLPKQFNCNNLCNYFCFKNIDQKIKEVLNKIRDSFKQIIDYIIELCTFKKQSSLKSEINDPCKTEQESHISHNSQVFLQENKIVAKIETTSQQNYPAIEAAKRIGTILEQQATKDENNPNLFHLNNLEDDKIKSIQNLRYKKNMI